MNDEQLPERLKQSINCMLLITRHRRPPKGTPIRVISGADAETIARKREWAHAAEEIIARADRAARLKHKREGHHIHHVVPWFEIPGETKRSLLVGSIQNREGNLVYLPYRDHYAVHFCEHRAYRFAWKSGLEVMHGWMYDYHDLKAPKDLEQRLHDYEIFNTDKSAWPASRVLLADKSR